MIRNYFITAWRNISRNKAYTAINVLGLSLGVCACLIIYLITSFELSYDTFHPDKDRIYRIVADIQYPDGNKDAIGGTISPLPVTMRSELTGFENVTAFYNCTLKVTIPIGSNVDKRFEAAADISPIIIADQQYFKLFKYQWLKGDEATALNEPFKVVLSEKQARKYFGATPLQDVIGRQVIYGDSLHLTVSGIVKDWNKNTDFNFSDFISFATIQNSSYLQGAVDLKNWGFWDFNSQGMVKLAKGVTPQQVEKQFPQFVKAHVLMQKGMQVKLHLQPLADIHFDNNYPDSYTHKTHLPTLYALMGIAAFILIIAAINFINLSTAQSLRRAKEVGVRKVLGGSKTSLTVQFLIETFFVTALAVVFSVIITNPVIAAFHSLIPVGVSLNFHSLQTILFLVLVIVITSLLAGYYPARVLSSYLPVISLKGQGGQKLNRKSYFRKTLIVFQFTVSLVFIIGAVVIGHQIHFILNKDLGFNKDAIITIQTGGNPVNEAVVFATKVKQIPGVQLVSRHRITPTAMGHPGTVIKYKGAGEYKTDASFDMCDENYVPLFGLTIIAGRNILPSDTLKEFLINETCAKALGFKKPTDALGNIVEVGIDNARKPIVGVVKDFHSQSLHEAITPFFIGSLKKYETTVSIKLASRGKKIDNFKNTIAQIEKAYQTVYPNDKFEYSFFDENIAKLYDKEQKTAQLINTAMLIAIFISCMGLFGLATFTAQQRLKEIGIRKVLGASVSGIAMMLSRDFLVLVIVSLLIASPIAYYLMHQWLQGFAYRVNISWWVFLVSGASAIIIALVTVSFQSIKAALMNPVKSLHSE